MDTPTIVNIILCILSFILAGISVVTVIITLRQNHKMINNATRPYIVVYSATTNFQSPGYYLCVKNFGQSGAFITSFHCNCDLRQYSYHNEKTPFEHLSNTFIAPGQSFVCSINPLKLFKEGSPSPLTFTVKYSFNNQKYMDTFIINPDADSDLIHARSCTKDKELSAISYTLQEIAERLL